MQTRRVFRADPWHSPTYTMILSVTPTVHLTTVFLSSSMSTTLTYRVKCCLTFSILVFFQDSFLDFRGVADQLCAVTTALLFLKLSINTLLLHSSEILSFFNIALNNHSPRILTPVEVQRFSWTSYRSSSSSKLPSLPFY